MKVSVIEASPIFGDRGIAVFETIEIDDGVTKELRIDIFPRDVNNDGNTPFAGMIGTIGSPLEMRRYAALLNEAARLAEFMDKAGFEKTVEYLEKHE